MIQDPGAILLIKPGSFGDVIHALPCASALKKTFPQARLSWLIDDRWAPLLSGHPAIDDVVIFPRQKFRGAASLNAIPWALGLRRIKPDIALDLQGLLRSALMARCSGAHHIVGLADAREGAGLFYQQTTPVIPGEHSVRRYLRTLETLGLPRVVEPEFSLPCGEKPPGWKDDGPFVLLHPFARGTGKSLGEKHLLAFCRALRPLRVVLAGTGELKQPLPENTLSMLNQTSIAGLIWLIRAASFVVSVDSGPMHIAAAVTPRLLSIHTWSDPRLVGPFNEEAWIWQGGTLRHQQLNAPSLPAARTPGLDDIAAMADCVRAQVAA